MNPFYFNKLCLSPIGDETSVPRGSKLPSKAQWEFTQARDYLSYKINCLFLTVSYLGDFLPRLVSLLTGEPRVLLSTQTETWFWQLVEKLPLRFPKFGMVCITGRSSASLRNSWQLFSKVCYKMVSDSHWLINEAAIAHTAPDIGSSAFEGTGGLSLSLNNTSLLSSSVNSAAH